MPATRINAGSPQAANWKVMKEWRTNIERGVTGKPLSKRMPFGELVIEKPSVSRREGKLTIQGGPHFRLATPYIYESRSADERTGKLKRLAMTKLSILTWTSKMSCASFSLPAGVPGLAHGTCAAASKPAVMKDGSYLDYHASVADLKPLKYVCEICYAAKGNYQMWPSVSVGQLGRMYWLQYALFDGSFVRDMTESILSLFAPPHGRQRVSARAVMARMNIEPDYFRIHDSGDFFDTTRSPLFKDRPGVTGFEYYDAWVEIATALHFVKFWAPTRMWVFKEWADHFRKNPPPSNMSLRPSTLIVNQTIEDFAVPYMDAATSVYPMETDPAKLRKQKVYNCPAYKTDGKTCIEGTGPGGEAGCRACWAYKDLKVNYSEH